MKNALGHIDRWLDGVKADRRHLKAGSTCVVIAQQLSRKTNGSEFRKTGRLVTWQAIPTLAAATGLSERMVRYAVRRLEAAGHLTIKTGRGPGRSNHYTLIEKRHQSAAIDEANSGTRVPQLTRPIPAPKCRI
jgi:DNA-binding transcriptional regulator PaaX